MKNTEELLREEYIKKLESFKFSNKSKLYNLYEEPKHTPVLGKIVLYQTTIMILFLMLAISATAVGLTLHELVAQRTDGLNITDEKRDEMVKNLEEWGITPEDFSSNLMEIKSNKYGETYGNAFDGVNLIAVITNYDGKEVTGYIYRDDYDKLSNVDSIMTQATQEDIDERVDFEKARQEGKVRNWIYVYDSDGVNIIGKYIFEYRKLFQDDPFLSAEENDKAFQEYLSELQPSDFKYGFITNEELERDDISKYLINGSDSKQYKVFSQNRINTKTEGNQ